MSESPPQSDPRPGDEDLARRHQSLVAALTSLRRQLGRWGDGPAEGSDRDPSPGARIRTLDELGDRLRDLAREQARLRHTLDSLLDQLDGGPDQDIAHPITVPGGSAGDPRSLDTHPRRGPRELLRWLARALGWRLRSLLAALRPPATGMIPLAATLGAPARKIPPVLPAGAEPPGDEPGHKDRVSIEGPTSPPWPRGTAELVSLLFASEDLAGAELSLGPAGPILRCRRHAETGGKDSTRGEAAKGLVKVIRHDGGESAALAESGGPASGRYRAPTGNPPGRHQLHELSRLTAPGDGIEPAIEGERARWLVLIEDLLEGRGQVLTEALRHLGPERAGEGVIVVFEQAADRLDAERRQALRRAFPELLQLPLGDALAPEVVSSALVPIVSRHRPRRLLDLASAPLEPRIRRALTRLAPALEIFDPPWAGGGLPWVPPLAAPVDPEGARAQWRRRLRLDDDTLLVAQLGDLVPTRRGEDFVALAHHMRDDERFAFLLAGRGRCAGTIDDLARFLAPPRYHRLDAAPRAELLAAADIVCSTARVEPVGQPLLAALSMGRTVLAADPRLSSLLTTNDPADRGGRLVTDDDPEDWGAVLDHLADPEHRQHLVDAYRRAEPTTSAQISERWRRWLEERANVLRESS